jgi:hypothetical protein
MISDRDCGRTVLCTAEVQYQFCGLTAALTVYADDEAEARAKAVDQLRRRGLKVT